MATSSRARTSRRTFLKIFGGLAVTVAAGGVVWNWMRPGEEASKPGDHSDSGRGVRVNPYVEDGKAVVAIVKGEASTDVETMVRRAVDSLGGIGRIVSAGKRVVVKPSVFTSSPGCAPDPRVVAAVVKLATEAGGTVVVAENSGGGDSAYCMSKLGISSAVQKFGAEVRNLQAEKEVSVKVPKGIALQEVITFPTIAECDVLISVPRLKRHGSATVTISLKNMMGIVTKREMSRFHSTDLSQCIADLNSALKPDLTVVDATSAMTLTGPTGGEMVEMDTIFASGDPVAVDWISAQRLQKLEASRGTPTFNPANVRHINAAAALKVGTNDPDKMMLIEVNL